MKLWLLRHGFSGSPSKDPKKERDRPLLPEGQATVLAIAKAMGDLDEVPKAIFCSPYQRTIMTADLVGKYFGVSVNVIGELAPVRPMEDSIGGLITKDRLKRVMLVCHKDNSTPAMNSLGGDCDWSDLFMSEVRRVNIDRDSWTWKMKLVLKPSDVGRKDIADA